MSGLVFDLGGTHLRAAIATGDGKLVNATKERLLSVSDGLRAPDVWRGIRDRLKDYVQRNVGLTPQGSPIMLAFPGPIDESGVILQAPTLTGGDTAIPDLRAELEERAGPCICSTTCPTDAVLARDASMLEKSLSIHPWIEAVSATNGHLAAVLAETIMAGYA